MENKSVNTSSVGPKPTAENIKKAKEAREFLKSNYADYNRISLDIFCQYPISMENVIGIFEEKFGVERDKVGTKFAKLTLKNCDPVPSL